MKKTIITVFSVSILLGFTPSAYSSSWVVEFMGAMGMSQNTNIDISSIVKSKIDRTYQLYTNAKIHNNKLSVVFEDEVESILETLFPTTLEAVNQGDSVAILLSKYEQCKLTGKCGLKEGKNVKQFIAVLNTKLTPIIQELKK